MVDVKPCSCGAECPFDGDEDQPCWGEVCAVDEITHEDGDWEWVHACQGHASYLLDGQYRPSCT